MELDWWSELREARAIWVETHADYQKTLAKLDAAEGQKRQAEAAVNRFVATAMARKPGRVG